MSKLIASFNMCSLKPPKYAFIPLKYFKYAVICIYLKNAQNMHLHMKVCKCITILSLIITFDSIWMGITLPPSGCCLGTAFGAKGICGFANIGVSTGAKSAMNGSGAEKQG